MLKTLVPFRKLYCIPKKKVKEREIERAKGLAERRRRGEMNCMAWQT
jgi:hypothetical protein